MPGGGSEPVSLSVFPWVCDRSFPPGTSRLASDKFLRFAQTVEGGFWLRTSALLPVATHRWKSWGKMRCNQ